LEGKESWFTQDGHLATKPGPWTSQARKQSNLYSPSEVQQMKVQQANNTGPMLSQDRLSPQQRKNQERFAETIPISSAPSRESTSKTSVRQKVVDATKGVSEVAEKTSKAGQPEVVAGAIAMFKGSSAVGVTGQVSKTVSLAADGNTQDATLEATGIILSTATGSWANSIPGTDAVTKEAVKTTSEATIETGKTELIKDLNKKQ